MLKPNKLTMTSDYKGPLESLDCHFNWGINGRIIPKEVALISLEDAIHGYNLYTEFPVRRFAMCLHAAFIMYKLRKDNAYMILLCAANRVLEYSRDSSSPLAPAKIPTDLQSLLWELPVEQFLEECSHAVEFPDHDDGVEKVRRLFEKLNRDEEALTSAPAVEPVDGTLPLWNEDRFSGIYTGAKYVVTALEANMFLKESEEEEVEDLLSRTIPTSEMSASDRAIIRYIEAVTWRLFGLQDKFIKSLEGAVLANPNDIRWFLLILQTLSYVRLMRNLDWGRRIEWESVETLVNVVDSLLDLKPAQWIADDLNFEKLRAMDDVHTVDRWKLAQKCFHLSKTLASQTSQPETAAYCAQILSRKRGTVGLALSTIERVLANTVDHNRAYVNKRASNIYKNAGVLEKALICAETAAQESFGSKWQVLELKIELGREINPQEFFIDVERICRLPEHVEIVHIEAFFYYVCKTNDMKSAVLYFQKIMESAKKNSSKAVMGDRYCKWLRRSLNLAEAGYNVVRYVLDDKGYGVRMSDEDFEVFREVKEALEKDHLDKLRSEGKLNPREYVQRLRSANHRKDVVTSQSGSAASSGHYGRNIHAKGSGRGHAIFGNASSEKLSWRREMSPRDTMNATEPHTGETVKDLQ